MGVSHSRVVAGPCNHDDRQPILNDDYCVSECAGEPLSKHQGIMSYAHSQIYCSCKARLLNDSGSQVSNGRLEITHDDLRYRYSENNVVKITIWPLVGLREYGYCDQLFTFEAGRRCPVSGVFVFKCKQARYFYALLSEHVNTLALTASAQATLCTCWPNVMQETWKSSGGPSASAPQEIPSPPAKTTEVTDIHPHRWRERAPNQIATHSDRANHRRWRPNDDYIYLSRMLSQSSTLLLNRSPTSPTSAGSGGAYLIAVPNFTNGHFYENQHALVVSSCA